MPPGTPSDVFARSVAEWGIEAVERKPEQLRIFSDILRYDDGSEGGCRSQRLSFIPELLFAEGLGGDFPYPVPESPTAVIFMRRICQYALT